VIQLLAQQDPCPCQIYEYSPFFLAFRLLRHAHTRAAETRFEVSGAFPRDRVFGDSRKASAKAKAKVSLAPITLPEAADASG